MRLTLLLLPMTLCLTGCYTTIFAPGAVGRVVDADTGKPIRHARIIRPFIESTWKAQERARSNPQLGGAAPGTRMAWIPEDVPAGMVFTDARGEFNLPPAGRTVMAFLYMRNGSGIGGSFMITADGYRTNEVTGLAGPKTLWRVELGKVLLKKQ